MNVTFSGFQNSGYLVVKNIDKKAVNSHCLWTDFNNIGKKDLDKAQELLKDSPSKNGALFLSVDTKNVKLGESTIKVNDTLLKYEDKNLGAISRISKFLKDVTETKDELFSLDMNYINKFKNKIKSDPEAPQALKEESVFKIHNTEQVKKVAKQMFTDIQDKMMDFMKV